MSRPSAELAKAFGRRLRSIELSRQKIERLALAGKLGRKDAELVYQGLYLSAFVAFEGFLENLFIGLLVSGGGVDSGRSDVAPRIVIRSHKIARELVLGAGRKYVDWLPYNKTKELASLYFVGGRPFSDLSENHIGTLSKCATIRNAIAHRSEHSQRQFEEKVIGSTNILPAERKPETYLRGRFRSHPPQTRFENLVTSLLIVARELSR